MDSVRIAKVKRERVDSMNAVEGARKRRM